MSLTQIKNNLNKDIENVLTKLGIEYEAFSDNIYSTCPVHENSDNPRAFSFSLDKGIWKCWTRDCQNEYKNDVFGLIQGSLSLKEGRKVEFSEVLSWCRKVLKINTYSSIKRFETEEDTNEKFYNITKLFSKKHSKKESNEINTSFHTECPSAYFYNRGFNKKTLKYFQIGDCYESGTMYDRSIIPIHNDDGSKVVGLIGRSTKEYKEPKFLLYPRGFDKRFYFYNYHRAVKRANETSCLFLLEGQGDVWKMYESGVLNAMSLFGKTISEQQEEKLRKLSITHIIVLMDSDQAGREARLQIQRQLGRMYKLTFPKINAKDVGDMKPINIKKQILESLKGTF